MQSVVGAKYSFGGGVEMNHLTPRSDHDDSVSDRVERSGKVVAVLGKRRELILRAQGLLQVWDQPGHELHALRRIERLGASGRRNHEGARIPQP